MVTRTDLLALAGRVANGSMYQDTANSHPALKRGKVWCRKCRREQQVNSADALRYGWPKCHGQTMTIDEPPTWPSAYAETVGG